jgi:AraC-like DNA-binding protein
LGPECLSTHALPSRRQLACWNDWAARNWNGISISSREFGFPAELVTFDLGHTRVSRVRSPASVVRRRASGAGGPRMILHFQEHGHSRNTQVRREAALGRGDLTLLRLDEHYDLETSADVGLLVAEIDEKALRDRVGASAIRGAMVIDAATTGVALVGTMLARLCETAFLPEEPVATGLLERSLLDLVALAVLSNGQAIMGHGHNALFCRAVATIEHCEDLADLNGRDLADRLGVSQRALQLAFAHAGTTPSAYLLEHRLTMAARLLGNRGASITQIALDCGFSSSAHFSRCFAQRFLMPPREFRKGSAPSRWVKTPSVS